LDDATHLTLPVLDPGEAADLFRALAGDRVASADQATVERIVDLCGRLPLAVRVAAARLRLAPTGSPATLCAELADALGAGSGLEWLSDGHRAVSTALAVSYRHLTADQQRALWLACTPAATSNPTRWLPSPTPPCGMLRGCWISCRRPACSTNPLTAATPCTTWSLPTPPPWPPPCPNPTVGPPSTGCTTTTRPPAPGR
jgi:hypothetical protein